MGHFHSFKRIYFFCWAFSFALFTVHVVKNVQVTSKLSFYYKTYFVFKTTSSIIVICLYSAYNMFNRYHHAYQINQEKVQKSLIKPRFIVMKFQTPSPFYSPYLSSA